VLAAWQPSPHLLLPISIQPASIAVLLPILGQESGLGSSKWWQLLLLLLLLSWKSQQGSFGGRKR
jgi:hypothetical protein